MRRVYPGMRIALHVTFAGMLITCSSTGFARSFAGGAMCVLVCMRCACGRACSANVRTKGTKVAMMLRPSSQNVHGCAANVSAIEIDQCTIGFATFANISRSTRLGSMDGFFARLDTGLQVVLVRCACLHMVLRNRFKKRITHAFTMVDLRVIIMRGIANCLIAY